MQHTKTAGASYALLLWNKKKEHIISVLHHYCSMFMQNQIDKN